MWGEYVVRALSFVVAGFVAWGLYLLWGFFPSPWSLLVPAGMVPFILLRWRWHLLARAVGLVAIPTLALLGVNRLWAVIVGEPPDPPWFGLAIAAGVIGGAVSIYLRSWWVARQARHPVPWAFRVAVALVILPPIGVGACREAKGEDPLPNKAAVSELDIVLISAQQPPGVETTPNLRGWNVVRTTGAPTDAGVRWANGARPALRPNADRVLILDVDSERRTGRIKRWLALADLVTERDTPTFALLRTADDRRRARWLRALPPADPERPDDRRHGEALIHFVPVDQPATLTPLALRLAASAPTADEDLALAARHRPLLLFDGGERYAEPLNVDRLLESGTVRMCTNNQPIVAVCKQLTGAGDMENGGTHLRFDTSEVARATDETTIYVHVVRRSSQRERTAHLDYWWYLPDNPTRAGGGALCGAGFVISGITCHDHQSDWEGVTVEVDLNTDEETPSAVVYAHHNFRSRYTWAALRHLWSTEPTGRYIRDAEPELRAAIDQRPLVFIASGTHAANTTACKPRRCQDPTTGKIDNRHNGGKRWRRNYDGACASVCLDPLPTRRGGLEPARWNAFEGRWGTKRCDLNVFCSSTDAPRAPARQARYMRPWCAHETFDLIDGRPRRIRGADCKGPS